MWWWWGLLEGAGILHRTDFPPPFSGAAVHTLSAGRDEREILEHEPVNLRGVENKQHGREASSDECYLALAFSEPAANL